MLYPFGYRYSANNSNYNLSGIKMPFVTNSIPERVYLWCACRSMGLSAQLFTIFSPCSVLDVIFIYDNPQYIPLKFRKYAKLTDL